MKAGVNVCVADKGDVKPGDVVWQRIVDALNARVVRLSTEDGQLQFMRDVYGRKSLAKKFAAPKYEGKEMMQKKDFGGLAEQELAIKVVGKHWPGNITHHYVICVGYE